MVGKNPEVFIFVACYPPRLFGWLSLGLNYLNALTKITLLCVAFVKGISVWSTRRGFHPWCLGGGEPGDQSQFEGRFLF